MNYQKLFVAIMLMGAASFTACNHLSSKAQEMIGDYYLTAVSENEPVMELKADGSCTVHAIKPGIMSYTVNGEWNVNADSLIIQTDGKVASLEGDTSVVRIGTIPSRMSYAITDFTGLTLTLNQEGNDYQYQRRGHMEKE